MFNFSSLLETQNVLIFNNFIATRDNNVLNSPVLKSADMTKVKNVTRQGKLISYKAVAKKCPIQKNNAGRFMGRLKDHLDFTLVKEQRHGPTRTGFLNLMFNIHYVKQNQNPVSICSFIV